MRWKKEGKVWVLDTPEALYDYITKEAIKDYILEARPESEYDNLFLTLF